METGTGIFLSSLVIGLVMLYGQTKDRWNWRGLISKTLVALIWIASLSVAVIFYDPSRSSIDWSFRSIVSGSFAFFLIFLISSSPYLVLNAIYSKILLQEFEFNDEGSERLLYKATVVFTYFIFFAFAYFYYEVIKEVIHFYLFGNK
jgi:hypothetical protein